MIFLLQPPAGQLGVSGGYRYNQEVGDRLQRSGHGRLIDVAPQGLASELERLQLSRSDVVVFDSLYVELFSGSPEELLKGFHGDSRLLVHLFPSGNPMLSDQERSHLREKERAWIQHVDGVISVSQYVIGQLHQLSRTTKHMVASPGIDRAFRQQPYAHPPSNEGAYRVVVVGNLIPRKGQVDVVLAMESLARSEAWNRPLELRLVGDNQIDGDYTNQVKEAASLVDVQLLGCLSTDQVAEQLRSCHLYVAATHYESFGMATAEAVCVGIPVVATQTGDAQLWIDSERNGRLAAPHDREALRQEIERTIREPIPSSNLGRTERAPWLPTWEDTFRDFLRACDHVPSPHNGRSETRGPAKPYAECELPTEYGTFDVSLYYSEQGVECILLKMGDMDGEEPPFVRLHSECLTGEVFHSLKCDCQAQLEAALSQIATEGRGALVYLRQEGRGIGLGNKLRAYAEQAKGADTIEANLRLGFPSDLREFETAAQILQQVGYTKIRLNTNNPDKIEALRKFQLEVTEVVASRTDSNSHNENYLKTKFQFLGHLGLGADGLVKKSD